MSVDVSSMQSFLARAARLCLCIAVAQLAAPPLAAQTVPHQSSARGQFGTGLGQQALPRGGTFEPRIEAAVIYAENLTLAEDGAEQISSTGVEVAPGFYASYAGDNFTGAADYSLIGRWWDEDDFDDVSQRLAANGRWNAVPEWFFVDGQASYLDAVVEPSNGANYGGSGVFGQSNLVEMASTGLTPTFRRRLDDFEVEALYGYGRVWYLDEPDDLNVIGELQTDDATHQVARFSFGTAEDEERILSGSVFYDWNDTEYDTALPFRYERAGFDAGWRVTRSFSLVADAGVETDLEEDSTEGGLDEDFWHAGVRWRPDDRTSAEARVGQQFFGDSYLLAVSHEAQYLLLEASYSEDPVVEGQLMSVGDVDPGNLPPTDTGLDFGRLTTSPFVEKDGRIGATATGAHTRVRLVGYRTERDYLRGFETDEIRVGGTVGASRELGAKTTVDIEASYQDLERAAISSALPGAEAEHDYDTEVILRLNREAGARLTASVEGGFFNRGGAEDYDGWWVALRARYKP